MNDFSVQWLPLLQTLPAPLAALLMQQVLRSEVMFPREKKQLESTLESLRSPRSAEMDLAVTAFRALKVPDAMSQSNWQTEPAAWTERFTAAMWSSGQIEAYRNAAKLTIPRPPPPPPNTLPRAVVVMFDKDLRAEGEGAAAALFRRLRSLGTLYTSVQNVEGMESIRKWMEQRAASSQERYTHWCVSGDESLSPVSTPESLATLTYTSLQPARQRLLQMMNAARTAMGTGGPEGLRHTMQALTPDEMGLPHETDPVMRTFATDVLVGGSGTQLYSTTFVQWTTREVLRRAQPQTLVARFTARNQSSSMDLRLAQPLQEPPLDFGGSLVDAEMGAYLTYLNMLRLPGAEKAHFVLWHEGYGQAMLIGPGVEAGEQNASPIHLSDLLRQIA